MRRASLAAQLWAVAALTFKEAVRRKAFFILILFAAAVMSSMTFFASVDPASKLRLVEVWSLRATVFFGALAAIFLGAFSLSADYEAKRILVVASKPISKITLFLGKWAGLALMLAAFLGIMGLLSLGYLRVVKAAGGGSMPDLRARPRVAPDRFHGTGDVQVHPTKKEILRTARGEPGVLRWRFDRLSPERFPDPVRVHGRLRIRNRLLPGPESGKVRFVVEDDLGQRTARDLALRSRDPFSFAFPRRYLENQGRLAIHCGVGEGDLSVAGGPLDLQLETKDGARVRATGFDAVGVSEADPKRPGGRVADGWAHGALLWRFGRLAASRFPPSISARIRMEVYGVRSLLRFTGNVKITARTPDGAVRHEQEIFCKSNEWIPLTFPRSLLERGGKMIVSVVPGDPDMQVAARPDSLELFEEDESFDLNFAKGLLLIYGWIVLLMSAALAASAFLSGPMSVFIGAVFLGVGSIYSFSEQAVREVDLSMARYYRAQEKGEVARTPEDFPPWLLEYSRYGSKAVLFLFPDAARFDFSEYLVGDLAVGVGDLARAARDAWIRIAVLLFLGILIMVRRDFG